MVPSHDGICVSTRIRETAAGSRQHCAAQSATASLFIVLQKSINKYKKSRLLLLSYFDPFVALLWKKMKRTRIDWEKKVHTLLSSVLCSAFALTHTQPDANSFWICSEASCLFIVVTCRATLLVRVPLFSLLLPRLSPNPWSTHVELKTCVCVKSAIFRRCTWDEHCFFGFCLFIECTSIEHVYIDTNNHPKIVFPFSSHNPPMYLLLLLFLHLFGFGSMAASTHASHTFKRRRFRCRSPLCCRRRRWIILWHPQLHETHGARGNNHIHSHWLRVCI